MRYFILLLLTFTTVFCTKKESATKASPVVTNPAYTYFPNEVMPASSKNCFNGAYYRKVVSSTDAWGGISGFVTLPTISFDPSRINPAKPSQFLDNPSVYLGGNMNGQETDIGLTWEVIKDAQGNVTADRRAFRPFLRRTGHAGSGQQAAYENAPAEAGYYWYPGEEVFMSVKIISNGLLRLTIEGAGKKFEKDFECNGYVFSGKGEFKRVNAIDQVANEGKPVQFTRTKITGAAWKSSSLYRINGTTLSETPFHEGRSTDMRCPSTNYFSISATQQDKAVGAEKIDIKGDGY